MGEQLEQDRFSALRDEYAEVDENELNYRLGVFQEKIEKDQAVIEVLQDSVKTMETKISMIKAELEKRKV